MVGVSVRRRLAARFFLFIEFEQHLFGARHGKFHVGHEVGAELLGDARALELTQRMAAGSRNDEFVRTAVQCSHEGLDLIHRGVVDVDEIRKVEHNDACGTRGREARRVGDVLELGDRTEEERTLDVPVPLP